MINGIHVVVFSRSAESMQAFLKDVLDLPFVDAGDGWPIFAAPPTDVAVHASDEESGHEMWLMCDDIKAATSALAKRGVKTEPITDRGWGLVTRLYVAGGDEIGLYEPKHPMPQRRAVRTRRAQKASAAKRAVPKRKAAKKSTPTRAAAKKSARKPPTSKRKR